MDLKTFLNSFTDSLNKAENSKNWQSDNIDALATCGHVINQDGRRLWIRSYKGFYEIRGCLTAKMWAEGIHEEAPSMKTTCNNEIEKIVAKVIKKLMPDYNQFFESCKVRLSEVTKFQLDRNNFKEKIENLTGQKFRNDILYFKGWTFDSRGSMRVDGTIQEDVAEKFIELLKSLP